MNRFLGLTGLSLLLNALVLVPTPARAMDAAALELGASEGGVDRAGLALRWDWERQWFTEGEWHLGGYWELSASYWDGDAGKTGNGSLLEVGLTPVFRLQRGAPPGGTSPYAEIGVGPHLMSETRIDDKEMSTSFQFGSHLGFGARFGAQGHYELGYRFQHLSNAGIDHPNPGINFHLLRVVYHY